MATATSVLPRLLDAIQDGLSGLPALDGVTVLSGPMVIDKMLTEWVMIGTNDPSIGLPQAPGAQDLRYRKEALTIPCTIRANAAGAGEEVIRQARNRVFELFAVVETWVRENKTAGIPAVDALSIRAAQFGQGWDDNWYFGAIRFDLEANTSLIDSGM